MKRRNAALEGLRGFLATAVALYHIQRMGATAGWFPEFHEHGVLDQFGVYLVSMFFCISGYLIVQSLVLKSSLADFARNRAIRIYPVFLVLHVLIYIAGPITNYNWMGMLRGRFWLWLGHFVADGLFLPGIFNMNISQKNAWSLSYEALFYVVAGLIFFAARHRLRWMIWLFVGLSVLAVVYRPLCIYFVVGYLAYLLEKRGVNQASWLGAASVPCFIAGAIGFPVSPLIAVPFVGIVFYGVVVEAGPFTHFLKLPIMKFLGKISFSLYLIHPFVFAAVRAAFSRLPGNGSTLQKVAFVALSLTMAIPVSYCSYLLIEQKFTRWLIGKRDNDRLQST